jgi:hypothetical protein
MTKEMKRPTSHISGNSIKPALSKAVEFYTDNNRQAYECIHERDEYIDYLESKLSNARPQQALPVVPECVGEWINKNISVAHNAELMIHNILICAIDNKNRYLFPLEVEKFVLKNPITFLNAVITGKYQVEKPQLFYLKNKLTGDCLARASSGLYVEVTEKWLTRKEQTSYKLYFTQKEIASMQTGSYEQIEVAE